MFLAAAYNNELVQEIEARIDIVELIGEDCELTRKGNRYWGLCPFHSEKTSSFSVSQERQLFYCFGCHEGGNIFGYIMKKRNLEFGEALAYLAEKAGIDTSRYTDSRVPKKSDIDRIVLELNQEAAKFYHKVLLSEPGRLALKYLHNRGVSDESIEGFGLGLAPDDWRPLQQHLLDRGYSVESMMESGLIRRSQKGDQYMDFFRNRVIFPIYNQAGQVIAFGGRIMEGDGPKYLNSAENRVFSKRHNLFGLYQGRNDIRETNEVILVEGYMDCLQLHQHGIKNAVATLGTAFTREQSKLVKRLAQKVIVMYDGDAAGQRETLKAIKVLQDEGLEPLIVTLPNESDPDEFVQKHGKEEFLKFVQNNRFTAMEYKLENLVKPGITLTWERKLQVLDSLFPDVESSESPLAREKQFNLLAMKIQLSARDVEKEFASWRRRHNSDGSIRNRNSTFRNNRKYAENSGNARFEERMLVKMANSPELRNRVEIEIGIDFFSNTAAKRIASIIYETGGINEHREVLSRINEALLQEHELEKLWARACLLEEEEPLTEQEVEEFLRTQKVLRERSRWQNFAAEVKALESNGDFYSALTSIVKLGKMTAEARKEGRHEN